MYLENVEMLKSMQSGEPLIPTRKKIQDAALGSRPYSPVQRPRKFSAALGVTSGKSSMMTRPPQKCLTRI